MTWTRKFTIAAMLWLAAGPSLYSEGWATKRTNKVHRYKIEDIWNSVQKTTEAKQLGTHVIDVQPGDEVILFKSHNIDATRAYDNQAEETATHFYLKAPFHHTGFFLRSKNPKEGELPAVWLEIKGPLPPRAK